jgi:hypothetical protein
VIAASPYLRKFYIGVAMIVVSAGSITNIERSEKSQHISEGEPVV